MKKIAFVFVFLFVLLGFGVSAAMAYQTYLPMVNNQASPTPTSTPTLTPTPIPTVDPDPILLPNGDFEQGHVVWNEYSNYGFNIINHEDDMRILPYHGEWAAWMGGALNDYDTLDQDVYIPSDHPYLSFWLWILSTDVCNSDFAWIHVNADQIDKHDLCYDHNTNGWVQKTYDLSAYSGQTVNLKLTVDTDGSYISSIYFDDFEFQASAP